MSFPTLHSFILLFSLLPSTFATTYEVGPHQKLSTLAEVPWPNLQPGDIVAIHSRPNPYHEKFVLSVRGSAEKPIVIRGIPAPDGSRPIIDGRDAVTPNNLHYWGGERSVIKIGGATEPANITPAHLLIENLDIRSARPPFQFTSRKGLELYTKNAASLFIEKGENLVIRNCALHDSGNGLFASHASRNLLIDHCQIYDNGIENSIYEHNSYTEALQITFENNHFGPLRPLCLGNNLKDRSAGLIVRNNWIEGGNRALDLVDAEGSAELRNHPSYRHSWVYNNTLIKLDDAPNHQVVHYGGDSGKLAWYRQGTLHFFHNTVISRRTKRTTLFGLSSNAERVEAQNNLFYDRFGGSKLALCDGPGQFILDRNWFSTAWVTNHGFSNPTISGTKTSLTGDLPGFTNEPLNNFRLLPNSPAIQAASPLPPNISSDHPIPNPKNLGASPPNQPPNPTTPPK